MSSNVTPSSTFDFICRASESKRLCENSVSAFGLPLLLSWDQIIVFQALLFLTTEFCQKWGIAQHFFHFNF